MNGKGYRYQDIDFNGGKEATAVVAAQQSQFHTANGGGDEQNSG
jgi:hypothetical protein